MEATTGFEPVIRVLQTRALPLGYVAGRFGWSGRRDLNPRPSPWQGDALPLRHFRSEPDGGAEEETRTPTLAMSTAPSTLRVYQFHHLGTEAACGRSGGTRTPDLRFWRPLLCQTELHSSARASIPPPARLCPPSTRRAAPFRTAPLRTDLCKSLVARAPIDSVIPAQAGMRIRIASRTVGPGALRLGTDSRGACGGCCRRPGAGR